MAIIDRRNNYEQSTELIDSGASIVGNLVESTDKSIKKLLHWDELEEWQKDNEYIRTGYVKSEKSMKAVFQSLGFVHNETGNIYSHLVPSLIILLILLCLSLTWTPPFVLFGVGCVLCLGMSAAFHCLKSHSDFISILGNKLDYLGICILIATSMISLIELSFNDKILEHHLFISLTTVLGIICSFVSLSDKFRSSEYRPVRAAMFVCYGLSGILPIFVGWIQFGYEEIYYRTSCGWLYAEAFFYVFGAYLYAIRFPEKYAPGNFDIIGHSHQIFHVFVVVAAYCHYTALVNAQNYMKVRDIA